MKFGTPLPQLDKFMTLLREKKNVDKDALKLIDKTILVAEKQLKLLKRLQNLIRGLL